MILRLAYSHASRVATRARSNQSHDEVATHLLVSIASCNLRTDSPGFT